MNPLEVFSAACKQRPGATIAKIFAGDNWPQPGAVITFEPHLTVHYVRRNTPGCDSAIQWADGFVTILRDSDEPGFNVAPPRPGAARVGNGKNHSGTHGKKRKGKR